MAGLFDAKDRFVLLFGLLDKADVPQMILSGLEIYLRVRYLNELMIIGLRF